MVGVGGTDGATQTRHGGGALRRRQRGHWAGRLSLGEARGSGGCQRRSKRVGLCACSAQTATDTCTDSPDTGQTPSSPANLRPFRTAAVCEHYLASSSMLPRPPSSLFYVPVPSSVRTSIFFVFHSPRAWTGQEPHPSPTPTPLVHISYSIWCASLLPFFHPPT